LAVGAELGGEDLRCLPEVSLENSDFLVRRLTSPAGEPINPASSFVGEPLTEPGDSFPSKSSVCEKPFRTKRGQTRFKKKSKEENNHGKLQNENQIENKDDD
jgi:hypothetical protein